MEEEKAVGEGVCVSSTMRETQGDTYTQNPATIVGPLSYKT